MKKSELKKNIDVYQPVDGMKNVNLVDTTVLSALAPAFSSSGLFWGSEFICIKNVFGHFRSDIYNLRDHIVSFQWVFGSNLFPFSLLFNFREIKHKNKDILSSGRVKDDFSFTLLSKHFNLLGQWGVAWGSGRVREAALPAFLFISRANGSTQTFTSWSAPFEPNKHKAASHFLFVS